MAEPATARPESPPRARAGSRAAKSATAFRTISEVAVELDVAQHVLRFWESKFPQVRPLKRGGGRRYYRPEDVELLRQIRTLLYDEGYTIKGAQKLLKGQRRPLGDDGDTPAEAAAGDNGVRAAPTSQARGDSSVAPMASDVRGRLVRLRDELVMLREALRETVD
jgi:DNA-binding transcriptional MerR regulator